MDIPPLGKLASSDSPRDAVHIAIVAVQADRVLTPGQRIGMKNGKISMEGPAAGVVDPYLVQDVMPGEYFWVMLFPGTITSLRHQWTHPAFPQDTRDEWMQKFADMAELPYETVMRAAKAWLDHDEVYTQYGSEAARDAIYVHQAEFWKHYEMITGLAVAAEKKDAFFGCAC